MKRLAAALGVLVLSLAWRGPAPSPASTPVEEPVVRAVLFYSPTCPHCHQVINEDLPHIFAQFGGQPQVQSLEGGGAEPLIAHLVWNDRFRLLLVDVSRGLGGELYESSIARFAIPENRRGVPQLVFAEHVLVGSVEIPRDLPGLIAQGLVEGGADWPSIPGLTDVVALAPARDAAGVVEAESEREVEPDLATVEPPGGDQPGAEERPAAPPTVQESAAETEPEPAVYRSKPSYDQVGAAEQYLNSLAVHPLGLAERLGRDPVGNGLAIVILLGMLAGLAGVATVARRRQDAGMPGLVIPILLFVGIGIAAYMAYVETQGASAVCGPVGDCNAVQHSPYARVFGLIPVGIVGVIGYLLLLGAWVVARVGERPASDIGTAGFFLFALAGTAFSAYLTFLEPFVIGAVCVWCLSSAVLITALMLLSARAGVGAVQRLRGARAA
jgi:uncharacterized membrane protein